MAPQYYPDRHRLSWTYVVTFELITIMFCDVSSGLEFRSVVMYFLRVAHFVHMVNYDNIWTQKHGE